MRLVTCSFNTYRGKQAHTNARFCTLRGINRLLYFAEHSFCGIFIWAVSFQFIWAVSFQLSICIYINWKAASVKRLIDFEHFQSTIGLLFRVNLSRTTIMTRVRSLMWTFRFFCSLLLIGVYVLLFIL